MLYKARRIHLEYLVTHTLKIKNPLFLLDKNGKIKIFCFVKQYFFFENVMVWCVS